MKGIQRFFCGEARMKSVLIAIPQLTGGGAERVASVWANNLTHRGYEVHVVLCHRNENEYFLESGVSVDAVADHQEAYHSMNNVDRLKGFRKIVQRIKPDAVISFLPWMQIWMMFACMGLRTKRIDTIRNNPWLDEVKKTHRVLWRLSYRTCDAVIVQSEDQIPFLRRADQKKCVLIPNPMDSRYKSIPKIAIDEHSARFMAAGRIVAQKNYPLMLRAFARIHEEYPQATLQIFGKGEEAYTEQIRQMVCAHGLSDAVRLMGRSDHIEKEYGKNDVFLLTSDYEGLPNALIEAMACGLVCISTDCKTGPRDLIEHGKNGFLVSVDNDQELYDAMQKVMKMSKEDKERMSMAAREKVFSYCSEENSVERLCTLLSRLWGNER